MKTWDEFESNVNASFGGGHHSDGLMDAYRHGINTVCNVLRSQFPAGPDAMRVSSQMESALRYLADRDNYDDDGMLRRPGGGRQEGIVIYSATIYPWVFAAQFV